MTIDEAADLAMLRVDKARAWDAIEEKNAEIARLRSELDAAKQRITNLEDVGAHFSGELDAARRALEDIAEGAGLAVGAELCRARTIARAALSPRAGKECYQAPSF